jgi:hypothetical protein
MKNIKRNITVVLLLSIGTILFAQRIGIQTGGVITGLQQSTATTKGDFTLLSGALCGPEVEFRISSKYSINVAALAELRAGRYDISWYKPNTTFTRTLYYAQVPLHFTYRKPWGKNANMLYYGGPRLNVGLFGTTNEHYTLASKPQINDSSCFGGGNAMNRMDIGIDLGIGIELHRFQFKLNYTLPLTNSAYYSELNTLKQHQLQLMVGITLQKFKIRKQTTTTEVSPAVSK